MVFTNCISGDGKNKGIHNSTTDFANRAAGKSHTPECTPRDVTGEVQRQAN